MDRLDNLPIDDEDQVSSVDLATAQKYLSSSQKKRQKARVTVRKIGMVDIAKWAVAVTLIFLLVSNQWFDKLLGFLPTESTAILFMAKALIFFVLSFVVLWKFS